MLSLRSDSLSLVSQISIFPFAFFSFRFFCLYCTFGNGQKQRMFVYIVYLGSERKQKTIIFFVYIVDLGTDKQQKQKQKNKTKDFVLSNCSVSIFVSRTVLFRTSPLPFFCRFSICSGSLDHPGLWAPGPWNLGLGPLGPGPMALSPWALGPVR